MSFPVIVPARVEVIFKNRKTGEVKKFELKTFTYRFERFLFAILQSVPLNLDRSVTLRAIDGVNYGVKIYEPTPTTTPLWVADAEQPVRLGIGTSSVSPTKDDYQLGALTAVLDTVSETYTDGVMAFAGTYTPTADVTIYEVCLYREFKCTDGVVRRFMLLRGIIAGGFTMVAATTYTVEVRITFA